MHEHKNEYGATIKDGSCSAKYHVVCNLFLKKKAMVASISQLNNPCDSYGNIYKPLITSQPVCSPKSIGDKIRVRIASGLPV